MFFQTFLPFPHIYSVIPSMIFMKFNKLMYLVSLVTSIIFSAYSDLNSYDIFIHSGIVLLIMYTHIFILASSTDTFSFQYLSHWLSIILGFFMHPVFSLLHSFSWLTVSSDTNVRTISMNNYRSKQWAELLES